MYITISPAQVGTFMMIFIRIGAILFTAPLFGSRDTPAILKAGFALMIAWIIYTTGSISAQVLANRWLLLLPAFVAEIMIGILIGLTVRLLFEGVQIAGQLIGFQMGFGVVNVIDPQSGSQYSIIAQLQNMLAMILFFALSMHQWFLKAIALSFERIPIFHCGLSKPLLASVIELSSNMFVIAVKVGAPIFAILLFTSVALGLIARTVPQMNVFIVGFPLKIAVGLFSLGFSLPIFFFVMEKFFGQIGEQMSMIVKLGYTP